MLKKWCLRPDPSADDPARCVLLIKGDMKDVTQILKKFGSLCGRPLKTARPEEFNFSLDLHAPTALGLEAIRKFLEEAAPGMGPALPASLPPPAPAPAPEPPASEPLQSEVGEQMVLTRTVGPSPMSVRRMAAASSASDRPPWSFQSNLDRTCSLDNLLVGSFNRFAHAAATSVIESPGSKDNPLLIHGAPGVGKTHLLHAIGAALNKTLGDGSVVLTAGISLADAVSHASAAGRMGEIEALLASAKVLLVDDIHLLSISEKNQAQLAKLFQAFFSKNLQVVFTSIYPPRALGSLEEALKLSLAKGKAVEMKLPSPMVQGDIIQAYAERNAVPIAPAEITKLVERLGSNFAEFSRLLLLRDVLTAHYKSSGQTPNSDDIISDLLNPGVRASQNDIPDAAELDTVKGFSPPASDINAPCLAVFYPKGQETMANWTMSRFYQTASASGIVQTYRHVLLEAYDADNPFGVPFQIGESCGRCGAGSALILGPGPESKLATRLGEFSHAVGHILDGLGISRGWIPYAETTITRPFLTAHMAFMIVAKT